MSRAKIIEIAHSQLGVTESPAGSNKNPYGKWYGWDGYAWCAMFVSWVYDQAGHPLGKINDPKGYRDCQSGYNYWKAKRELTAAPETGDIVLFDWEGNGLSDHTGIFHEWADAGKKHFWCYEGNTAVGDDSNGGIVMRRKRSVATVKAFVKPAVLGGTNTAPVELSNVLKKGHAGANVSKLQKQLYDLGYKLTVDGDFGTETEKTVKQFQKDNKLPVTGEADEALRGLIENKLKPKPVKEDKLTTGSYLKKGNSGAPVVALQKALNKKAAKPKLVEDGVFGDDTVKAVKYFQQKSNLKVDGVAGPETLKALGIK
ncbi:MAG TPA: peptidoglycan-binding protein [Flavobacteriales bacterium]|nr:peptidoglycan-binding protein [Flavobacteriales bacterium]